MAGTKELAYGSWIKSRQLYLSNAIQQSRRETPQLAVINGRQFLADSGASMASQALHVIGPLDVDIRIYSCFDITTTAVQRIQ